MTSLAACGASTEAKAILERASTALVDGRPMNDAHRLTATPEEVRTL
jgi:hypothetical protein